jgi:beta-phosphoglucomutase-like phosphatase (HAD superfamily)
MAELGELRSQWREALASADRALHAVSGQLPEREIGLHRHHLTEEYAPTTRLLAAYAHDEGLPAELAQPFLPRDLARRLLRLPHGVTSCVFDLEGVLVESAVLHALAWQRTFDEFLSERVESTFRRHLAPFDLQRDYPPLHGRPRLEGVRMFLASRGIRLPEGSPDDRPGAETVNGLGNRKSEILSRLLDERGVLAYDGSRRYLELAHDAGLRCAVVSASRHTDEVLEHAGLAGLVDAEVDAATAPEQLYEACGRLGVVPEHAAVFETTAAGVAAGRAAGFQLVVAVGPVPVDGADVAVPGLAELLQRAA